MMKIQVLSMLLVFNVTTLTKAEFGKVGDGEEAITAITGYVQQGDDEACPIAAAMEKLPKIRFVVGEQTLWCEKSAAAIAEKSDDKIHYCVGEQEFDAKADAQVELLEATEKFVSTFPEPRICKTSGKITVAGSELHCIFCARSLAKKMNDAMDGVQMTYIVGEEECNCPDTATKLGEKAGVEKQFVVGEEKTCCEHTARLTLAHARYKAAVAVLAESTAKKDASERGQGT